MHHARQVQSLLVVDGIKKPESKIKVLPVVKPAPHQNDESVEPAHGCAASPLGASLGMIPEQIPVEPAAQDECAGMLSPLRKSRAWGPDDSAVAIERLPRLAYRVDEVAAMLGISEKSVRRLIARGLLKPSKALRHLLITRQDLERFLKVTTR